MCDVYGTNFSGRSTKQKQKRREKMKSFDFLHALACFMFCAQSELTFICIVDRFSLCCLLKRSFFFLHYVIQLKFYKETMRRQQEKCKPLSQRNCIRFYNMHSQEHLVSFFSIILFKNQCIAVLLSFCILCEKKLSRLFCFEGLIKAQLFVFAPFWCVEWMNWRKLANVHHFIQ